MDWDIITPVGNDETPDEPDNDGVYFGDDDQQNNSFVSIGICPNDGTGENDYQIRVESQSFNPRANVSFFDQSNDVNPTSTFQPTFLPEPNEAPTPTPVFKPSQDYYKALPNSYSDRKFLEKDEYSKRRNRGNHFRGPRGGSRMRSESDAPPSFIPNELLRNFTQSSYDEFHQNAIEQRTALGIGQSQDMTSLFYFWCYYLRENFIKEMYDEFLQLAREDVAGNQHYGIECFFRFCSYGLEKRWDENIFLQFQNEALDDYHRGSTYGLEKVKAFLIHNKHEFEIHATPEMEEVLKQFPTLESFKKPNTSSFTPKRQEARSIPKYRQLGTPENNNRPKRGAHQRNNPKADARSPGNQNRGRQGQNNRNQPREWTFGKMQPASAPKVESPDLRRNAKH